MYVIVTVTDVTTLQCRSVFGPASSPLIKLVCVLHPTSSLVVVEQFGRRTRMAA